MVDSMIIKLRLFQVDSLKDKRQIVKSIIERLRGRYNISISELGGHELYNYSEIGVACISNDAAVIDSIFNGVINFIDNDYRVEIVEIDR